jgi:hypothetical protein
MPVGIEPAKQEDTMKKFLVVLLSLGLIAAFAATASALDVKFSGQYYVTGQYESNRAFANAGEQSLANTWTRTRVRTDFAVADGLSFTTRFDALEKHWNGNSNSRNVAGGDTVRAQENIEFEQGYVTFKTRVGQFDVGYQDAGVWGTGFGDTPGSRARVKLTSPFGPLTMLAIWEKIVENNVTNNAAFRADADADNYMLAGIYKFKAGDAGLLFVMTNDATGRPGANTRAKVYNVTPYMKATFGPVYVEAEFQYLFGKTREFDSGVVGVDLTKQGYGAYALAKMKLGPAYVGASFGYSSGDDNAADDKDNTGTISSTSWSPGIIFGDANYKGWSGNNNPGGANGLTFNNSNKQNLWAYNLFAGYNVTPKLNIDAQLWYLQADKVAAATSLSKTYGTEFDVTATYKIYDNLSYMVGAGYFWTGDYFKGTVATNTVGNDYLLLNKLTLNF